MAEQFQNKHSRLPLRFTCDYSWRHKNFPFHTFDKKLGGYSRCKCWIDSFDHKPAWTRYISRKRVHSKIRRSCRWDVFYRWRHLPGWVEGWLTNYGSQTRIKFWRACAFEPRYSPSQRISAISYRGEPGCVDQREIQSNCDSIPLI